jgi:hypothetical protein
MDHKELEKILVPKNKTIDAEGAAAASGSWGHYRAEKAPSQRTQLLLHPADNLLMERVSGELMPRTTDR